MHHILRWLGNDGPMADRAVAEIKSLGASAPVAIEAVTFAAAAVAIPLALGLFADLALRGAL